MKKLFKNIKAGDTVYTFQLIDHYADEFIVTKTERDGKYVRLYFDCDIYADLPADGSESLDISEMGVARYFTDNKEFIEYLEKVKKSAEEGIRIYGDIDDEDDEDND